MWFQEAGVEEFEKSSQHVGALGELAQWKSANKKLVDENKERKQCEENVKVLKAWTEVWYPCCCGQCGERHDRSTYSGNERVCCYLDHNSGENCRMPHSMYIEGYDSDRSPPCLQQNCDIAANRSSSESTKQPAYHEPTCSSTDGK